MTESTEMILIDPAELYQRTKAQQNTIQALYQGNNDNPCLMQQNVHYGTIAGTSGKPTLYKPGAELLNMAFGLRAEYEPITVLEDFDKPLFYYRYRARLVHKQTGIVMGEGIGSCNSMESKYRWRTAKLTCPDCGSVGDVMRSKYPPRNNPAAEKGWYCRACKANFDYADARITDQELGRVENEDIFSQVNTIDKMAQKRALVAATLNATAASEFFTQDLEDLPDFDVRISPSPPDDTPPDDGPPPQPETETTTNATGNGITMPKTNSRVEASKSQKRWQQVWAMVKTFFDGMTYEDWKAGYVATYAGAGSEYNLFNVTDKELFIAGTIFIHQCKERFGYDLDRVTFILGTESVNDYIRQDGNTFASAWAEISQFAEDVSDGDEDEPLPDLAEQAYNLYTAKYTDANSRATHPAFRAKALKKLEADGRIKNPGTLLEAVETELAMDALDPTGTDN